MRTKTILTTIQTDSASLVLEGKAKVGLLKRVLPFMGPAFVASVAYIDPGNFATNISAGSKYGYMLLWVIAASSLIAMLVQTLSAKLGIATGKNLAELCRDHFPRPLVWVMWVVMELAAIATDLAEFLGAALGFYLLFGIPLLVGGLLTAVATFLILGLQRFGFRPLEAVIGAMVGVVAACYLAELVIGKPDWSGIAAGLTQPRFDGPESVLLATGILGATVMPHVIYLHSALTQGRIVVRNPVKRLRLFRFQLVDVLVAMSIASLINMSMLIMAASAFSRNGQNDVTSIEQAYHTLDPLLGPAAAVFFGISLLASGLSSSSVATSAGQVIMQGFIHHRIPIWLRRGVTMVPALIVIALQLDPTRTLVISQVLLSFALPFAVIPLVIFTARKSLMGNLVNKVPTTVVAVAIAAVIVVLNLYLMAQVFQ